MKETIKEFLFKQNQNVNVEIWDNDVLMFNGNCKTGIEYYGSYFLDNANFDTDNEKWILKIGEKTIMELKDTVEDMLSDDYKNRFTAEYFQCKIRYEKLINMLDKIKAGQLTGYNPYEYIGFKPKTPLELLERQATAMKSYLDVLRIRAVIEGIKI